MAGSATNWVKLNAGHMKGQRVYLSKDVQQQYGRNNAIALLEQDEKPAQGSGRLSRQVYLHVMATQPRGQAQKGGARTPQASAEAKATGNPQFKGGDSDRTTATPTPPPVQPTRTPTPVPARSAVPSTPNPQFKGGDSDRIKTQGATSQKASVPTAWKDPGTMKAAPTNAFERDLRALKPPARKLLQALQDGAKLAVTEKNGKVVSATLHDGIAIDPKAVEGLRAGHFIGTWSTVQYQGYVSNHHSLGANPTINEKGAQALKAITRSSRPFTPTDRRVRAALLHTWNHGATLTMFQADGAPHSGSGRHHRTHDLSPFEVQLLVSQGYLNPGKTIATTGQTDYTMTQKGMGLAYS